jgi:hypothetical protein
MEIYGNIWIDIYIYIITYYYNLLYMYMHAEIYDSYQILAPWANFPIGRSLEAWKRPSTQVGTADSEGVTVNGLQRYCHGFLFVHLALESQ